MRVLLTSAALMLTALPALADETAGTVVAYDRIDHVLVMDDKTVWDLRDTLAMPDDLVAGDAIAIIFETAGDNGIGKIISITRSE